MPPTSSQIDPERPQPEPVPALPDSQESEAAGKSDGPLSFVPHEPAGSLPARIRTNRYGELEEHELIRLLDTIEDERARGRFRESIYISLFVWLAIAWIVFYGPRYLWHSPQLISPVDVMKQRAMVQLNNPILPHARSPAPKPVDNGTLSKLRAESKARSEAARTAAPPRPVQPQPTPAPTATPEAAPTRPPVVSTTAPPPLPLAPTPAPSRTPPPVVADAPTPQTATRPNFSTPGSASDSIQAAIRDSAKGGGGDYGAPANHGSGGMNTPVEILSDTQGVNFQPYLQRILRQIYQQWIPLLPEESRPPLSKQGITQIRFSIGADGTVTAMHLDGSTHDRALDEAAWGSVNGQQFPPLPKQFHGPYLELRIHYLVNRTTE